MLLGFCFLLSIFSYNQSTARDGTVLIYPPDNVFSDSARIYSEYYIRVLSELLNFGLDTTVVLYIADNEDDFRGQVGSSFPDWGAGAASLKNAAIVIKSPKYFRVGKSFKELIGHELTHIMLYRASGKQWLPRWLHEGLAMRVSGEWDFGQDVLVARAAWTNNLIPLYMLENLTAFNGAEANLAYTESYLAASDMIKETDRFLLADFLELYRSNHDFYRSFKAVVGDTYLNWTSNWYERTSVRYHLLLFLLDANLYWLLIPLFFIFLLIMKKRQTLKTKKRWKIEDRRNPPDGDYNQYYDGYYDDKDQV